MPLINCKVELKLRWTKHVFHDNYDSINSNNIIFTIKDTKLYVPVVTLSAKMNQNPSRILSKGFKSLVYWNEDEKIVKLKIQQLSKDIFLNQNFVGDNHISCLFE